MTKKRVMQSALKRLGCARAPGRKMKERQQRKVDPKEGTYIASWWNREISKIKRLFVD